MKYLDTLLFDPLLGFGIAAFGLGVVLAAAASISFRWRASPTNEPGTASPVRPG